MYRWRWSASAVALALLAGQAWAAPACPSAGFTVVEAKASPLTRPIEVGPRRTVFVRQDAITTVGDLTDIALQSDRYEMNLQLKFTPEAAARLHEATTNRSGLHIAFVIGDHALGAVTWTGPYGMDADQGVQISLGKPSPEVRPWVEAVRQCIQARTSGALPH